MSSLLNVAILYLNPFWWFHACSVWCKKPFISYSIISAIMIILYKCTKIIFIKIVNYQGSCWYGIWVGPKNIRDVPSCRPALAIVILLYVTDCALFQPSDARLASKGSFVRLKWQSGVPNLKVLFLAVWKSFGLWRSPALKKASLKIIKITIIIYYSGLFFSSVRD